jgi:hypothetical protein
LLARVGDGRRSGATRRRCGRREEIVAWVRRAVRAVTRGSSSRNSRVSQTTLNPGYELRELANAFHGYYSAHLFLVEDESLRNARLNLIAATQQVIRNGLAILGVSAPESM